MSTITSRQISSAISNRIGYSFFNFNGNRSVQLYGNDQGAIRWDKKAWHDVTPFQFEAALDELRKAFPTRDLNFLDKLVWQLRQVEPRGITLTSFKYYPKFKLLSYLSDGFPIARFIFDNTFKAVCFAFIEPYRENYKLMEMVNPNAIPMFFDVKDFPAQFAKIHA